MKPLTIATRRILATLVAGGALAATSTAFAQGYGSPQPRVEQREPAPGPVYRSRSACTATATGTAIATGNTTSGGIVIRAIVIRGASTSTSIVNSDERRPEYVQRPCDAG